VRIAVVNGPGVNVDRELFERWCGAWGAELGVDLTPVFTHDVAAALADGADGIVVNPGPDAFTPELVGTSRAPTVWVDLAAADRPLPPALDDAGTMVIRGRGVWSYRWAVAHLLQRLSYPYETVAYGASRDHVGDLRLPVGDGPFAVAVLLHGGFWRERWERDTIEPLAVDLARRGYATWCLEYRRVGPLGGGWPTTCLDVAAGIDHLAELAGERRLDLDRVVLVGHSAGGHLALWAVKRAGTGGPPRVRAALAVSLAGVNDLVEAAWRGLGDSANATADFVGAAPGAYADASPAAQLPLGVRQLIVQGDADGPDFVDLSRLYATAAQAAGDDVELLELQGADHFHVITPTSAAWPLIAERIEALVPPA
jgi:acetyl esterase/lipase